MASFRDVGKRLKAIGLPVELCVKYERLCGVKRGARLSFTDRMHVSDAMIAALEMGVRGVSLSEDDRRDIQDEIRENMKRRGK